MMTARHKLKAEFAARQRARLLKDPTRRSRWGTFCAGGSIKSFCSMSITNTTFLGTGALVETFVLGAFSERRMDMRKLTLTFLAGAGALIASSAYAADEIQIGDSS